MFACVCVHSVCMFETQACAAIIAMLHRTHAYLTPFGLKVFETVCLSVWKSVVLVDGSVSVVDFSGYLILEIKK